MKKFIDLAESNLSIDIEELKKIINKWQSGELYEFSYNEGLKGERLYESILASISIYIDDLVEETMDRESKKLGPGDYGFNWFVSYPKSDVRSIGIEVCNFLDTLWSTPIETVTTDDIPAILEFLNTPPDKSLEAWNKWENYWKNLDYPARRKKLLADPKYN